MKIIPRTFLGIPLKLHEDYSEKLKLQKSKYKLSVVPPINYHLTFHYFGDRHEISSIVNSLDSIKFAEFVIHVISTGYFYRKKSRSGVLYIDVLKDNDKLLSVYNKIKIQLSSLNIKISEYSDWNPHITIGRVRKITDESQMVEILNQIKVQELELTVSEFALFTSQVSSSGSVYLKLFTIHSDYHHTSFQPIL